MGGFGTHGLSGYSARDVQTGAALLCGFLASVAAALLLCLDTKLPRGQA